MVAEANSCAECEALRARLRAALEERDAALLMVARERERLEVLLLAQPVPPRPRRWAARLWRRLRP
jgi:hypothetical protein